MIHTIYASFESKGQTMSNFFFSNDGYFIIEKVITEGLFSERQFHYVWVVPRNVTDSLNKNSVTPK